MRLCCLTHRRADPSFRIRWERFLPAFAAAGIEMEVHEIPARGRGAVFARAGAADAVVLHRRLLTAWDFARLRRHARRLIYDFDDALCYRAGTPHRSWSRARRFFRTVERSDLVLAGNRVLAGLARLRARRVCVVPSTLDVESYAPAEKTEEFTAVWIGQRATLPHLEAVREAITAHGFRLRVIADAAPPGAEHVPWAVATEARHLAECHVGLMPLPTTPFARGKSGYKLLQYYAAGLPAVASPVGVNRTLAAGGALLAREPDAWVAALRRLLHDPALRERLGATGRAFVARRYASSALAERLIRLLNHKPKTKNQ